mmetsp:Transcript_11826/g.27357  ORF Transcript_11826/g.27357 Transcript_11826/m.27357 type:complete len:489 (-) Transcript_11826:42-1508(-)
MHLSHVLFALLGLTWALCAYAEESSGFVILSEEDKIEAHRVRDACQGSHDRWFSVAAMFVGFREAIEACVIISVMVNILNKTGMPQMKRYVWMGVGGGFGISCVIGAGLVGAYYAAQNSGMSVKDKAAFSGVFSGLAAFFLTAVGIQFLRFRDIETKYKKKLAIGLESKVDIAHEQEVLSAASQITPAMIWADKDLRSTATSIFLLCFTAVLREGLETFIFLAAVSASAPPQAIAIGGFTGIFIGCAVGLVILYAGKAMKDMWWFLASTTVFILFISAGLVSMSASAFKSVAVLDAGGIDDDFAISRPVYDIYKATGEGHQQCGFWAVFRAIVGYQHNPSMLWWIVYLSYWFIVISIFAWRWYHGTLYSKWGPSGEPPAQEGEEGEGSAGDVEQGKMRAVELAGDFAYSNSSRPTGPPIPPVPPQMPGGQGGYSYVFAPHGYPALAHSQVGGMIPPMPPQPLPIQGSSVSGANFGAGVGATHGAGVGF